MKRISCFRCGRAKAVARVLSVTPVARMMWRAKMKLACGHVQVTDHRTDPRTWT